MSIVGSDHWRADCLKEYGKVLKGKRAHWCMDWDCLPIDETSPEFECCTCYDNDGTPA